MNWFVSVFIGLLNAAAGCFLAGYVANLCVGWYRIPSREGEAGYYVVFIAAGGAIAGLVLGVIVSRLVDAPGFPGFFRGLFAAVLLTAAIAGASAMLARARADIAPTIDGKELDLVVEIRFPPADAKPAPADDDQFDLSSVHMRTRTHRMSRSGSFAWDRLREEGGAWVLSARAPVYTQRGSRSIYIKAGGKSEGFLVPLRANPRRSDLEWSIWLPRARKDGKPAAHTLRYRYRVEIRPES